MADYPKLELGGSCSCDTATGLEENMGSSATNTQKISVLDHLNGFQYSADKSDSFVIDMESYSHANNNNNINNYSNKDIINPNSRITLQRSLSRKGSLRAGSGDKKINANPSPNGRDTLVATSSPRASLMGPSMPEKGSLLSGGTTDHSSSNSQVHHQITINTSSNVKPSSAEGRCTMRRHSFKRPQFSWTFDPKRVLFFFATLSSMGTMLLIYFTLSIGKLGGVDGNGLN